MAAVVVVGVEPGGESVASLGVGAVGVGVGPFVGQGAVEAFDFAVGLGPVGAGAFVGDVRAEGGGEVAGSVAGAVVGQDAGDGDCVVGEPGVGASPERGGGVAAFVGEQFGVGQPGVVVQGGV